MRISGKCPALIGLFMSYFLNWVLVDVVGLWAVSSTSCWSVRHRFAQLRYYNSFARFVTKLSLGRAM